MGVPIYQPSAEVKNRILNSKSYREFRSIIAELDKEYDWDSKVQEIIELDERPDMNYIEDLPGSELEKDGVKYNIHGIVHDEKGIKVSRKVKEYIRERCTEYHKPQEAEHYLCEEYIGKTFMFGNRMDDHRRFLFNWMGLGFYNIYNQYKRRLRNAFLVRDAELSRSVKDELQHERIKQERHIVQIVGKNLLRAMEDPVYLPKARALAQSLVRAPPIEFDIDFDGWKYSKLLEYNAIKRSKYMVDCMEKFAKQKNLKYLHTIVGLGHEPHIKVFLENPKYPAKLLLTNIHPE